MRQGKKTGRAAMPEDTLLEAEVHERITGWFATIERLLPGDYIALADFETMPGQARADSYFWCDQCFASGAGPHCASSGVTHSFHIAQQDTFDLLRHEYSVEDTRLCVIETRSFVLVQDARPAGDVLKLPRRDQRTEIQRMASKILCTKPAGCARRFQLPPMIADGRIFSTNPKADPWLLSDWSDRIEGGICCGRIFFLCYKAISQLVGFPNAQQWFDDDFRSKWTR